MRLQRSPKHFLADLNELWIEYQKLKDPFLRKTGNPLRAEMYCNQTLDALSDKKDIVLHLYGTGKICNNS